jgi:hypothetical protein
VYGTSRALQLRVADKRVGTCSSCIRLVSRDLCAVSRRKNRGLTPKGGSLLWRRLLLLGLVVCYLSNHLMKLRDEMKQTEFG